MKSLLVIALAFAFVGCADSPKEKAKGANDSIEAGNSLQMQGVKQYQATAYLDSQETLASGDVSKWTPANVKEVHSRYQTARAKLLESKSHYVKALDTAKDIDKNKAAKDSIINAIYSIDRLVARIDARLVEIQAVMDKKTTNAERLEMKRRSA